MNELIARRQFEPIYILLDICFLLVLLTLLLIKKKYTTVIVGLLAGILYMIVDFGVFHLLCHSRSITEGYSLFWVLLWMSMSYGFTNFSWIWLWISKDKHLFEWSFLILSWWFCCPMIARIFGNGENLITIQRTTGEYHGYMAMILFAGYFLILLWNLFQTEKKRRIHIPWLLAIGILVQFGWEAALLLGGIRSAGFVSMTDKLAPLVINSLLETNLGMPYIYLIYLAVSARFTEDLKKRKKTVSIVERLMEKNEERVTE